MGDHNEAMALWPTTEQFVPDRVLTEIRQRASAADTTGTLSGSTLDLLRGTGYFGLPVPRELNGAGASLLECAAVQRRLAMADPGLAIAVNMHLFSLGIAVEHWRRHRDTCGLLLEAISTQQRILASAFAEPGLGGAVLRSTAKAVRTDGGYLVTGAKSPCSLAADCDLVCFQMQAEPFEREGLMIALIPSSATGVRVERSWDALGMRGSASDTLLLEDCFVPDALVFHRSRPSIDVDETFVAGLVWFCVTTTATYLGVAGAAVAAVSEGLRRSRVSYLDCTRAELPSVQGQLGEVVAGLLTTEAACAGIAAQLDGGKDPQHLLPAAVATKLRAVDACTRAVEDAAELLGGKSYARTSILARLWRDVQAARFHPPTRLVARQIVGRWALDLPLSLEVDERPMTVGGEHERGPAPLTERPTHEPR